MFYRLKAKNKVSFNGALFTADINGLDPDNFNPKEYIFEIGTGKVEKVSRLISQYNLDILVESDYAPNQYAYLVEGV
jgi:hypothetical protein